MLAESFGDSWPSRVETKSEGRRGTASLHAWRNLRPKQSQETQPASSAEPTWQLGLLFGPRGSAPFPPSGGSRERAKRHRLRRRCLIARAVYRFTSTRPTDDFASSSVPHDIRWAYIRSWMRCSAERSSRPRMQTVPERYPIRNVACDGSISHIPDDGLSSYPIPRHQTIGCDTSSQP